jgi:hypothetical protein
VDGTAPVVRLVPILGCRHDDVLVQREARPASLVQMAVEGAESGLMSTAGAAHSPSRCQAVAWLLAEYTSDRESPGTALIGHPGPEAEECYVRTEEVQPGRQESSGVTGVSH